MPLQRTILCFALAVLSLLLAYAIVARWPERAPSGVPSEPAASRPVK